MNDLGDSHESMEGGVMAKDAPGMRGNRSRNENGQLRTTRGDKHVGTIEREYGRDFGVRSDMRVDTLLRRTGKRSIHELLDD
jgi:hypothetical protein